MARSRIMPWEDGYFEDLQKRENAEKRQRYKNMAACENGANMEIAIKNAAKRYEHEGRLRIAKVPEPFRVLQKGNAGKALIQFTGHAEPDFIGSLADGRCIVFESKYTTQDKIQYSAVTDHQAAALSAYHLLGAVAGVCCGIGDRYYFIPWHVFANMKRDFGRLYLRHADIARYEVYVTENSVKFLDYKKQNRRDGK